MAITHRDARNKALNKMDEREKKIWNERKTSKWKQNLEKTH